MNKKLIIFGTGELGELASFYFSNDSYYTVCGFVADDDHIDSDTFEGKPVVPFSSVEESFPPNEYQAHVALSYNKLNKNRKDKYLAMKNKGYEMASYVSSKSVTWNDLTHGDNCFILENQTIQPKVKIGNNVMIWSGNHLGHGCKICDHVYMASHICISGHVHIGERSFIGVNASFKDFIHVGDRAFIAMGACITKNVLNDEVVLAAQSTFLQAEDELSVKLRRKYFNL